MVQLDEQIHVDGSDITAKSTATTKDALMEAGIDFEKSREAALKFEKEKEKNSYQLSHSQPSSVPLQGDWPSPLVVGSAVINPNSNPFIYGTIKWIGTISQIQGYVAGVELVSTGVISMVCY